jgi:WYL domain
MLAHQLPRPLPPFAEFWQTLDDVFAWLAGTLRIPQLPRAQLGDLDPTWAAPRAITSWRRGVPLELIRYAGGNRLMVDIDYRAEAGRHGSRRVEPYSLRQTRDGNLLLFVINDYGHLRAYRVDRIAGVRPTAATLHAEVPRGVLTPQRTITAIESLLLTATDPGPLPNGARSRSRRASRLRSPRGTPLPLPVNVLLLRGTPSRSASGGRSHVTNRHAERLSMPPRGRPQPSKCS